MTTYRYQKGDLVEVRPPWKGKRRWALVTAGEPGGGAYVTNVYPETVLYLGEYYALPTQIRLVSKHMTKKIESLLAIKALAGG